MPEKSYLLPAHPFSAAVVKATSVCQASLVEGGAPGWGNFVSRVVALGRQGFLWERRGPVAPTPPASWPWCFQWLLWGQGISSGLWACSVTGGWASSRLPPCGHLPVPLPWADGSVPGGGVQRARDGGQRVAPWGGAGFACSSGVSLAPPSCRAGCSGLRPGPARQAATSPRERELTWTKILFIAEDEQGRLVFRTLIG